ncbi:uncharacterized protein LOC100496019 isoform X2 [Xenopus tropicalis]|nr:uncharacterized protein LOC100496019 isoform X2 [Xenopus tropicalis]
MLNSCWKCVKQQADRWTLSGDWCWTCCLFRCTQWQSQLLLVFCLIVSSWAYKAQTPESTVYYKIGHGRVLLEMPAKLLADKAQFGKRTLMKTGVNGEPCSLWTFMSNKYKFSKKSVNNYFSARESFPLANPIQYSGKRRFMRQLDSVHSFSAMDLQTPYASQKDSKSAINAMVDQIIGRKESLVPLKTNIGGHKIVASDTDLVLGASEWQLESLENFKWLQKEPYNNNREALMRNVHSAAEEILFSPGNQPLTLEHEITDTTTLSSLSTQSISHSEKARVNEAVTEKDAETVSQHSSQLYGMGHSRLPTTADVTVSSTPKNLLLAATGHMNNGTGMPLYKKQASESATTAKYLIDVDNVTLAAGNNIPDVFFDMPDNVFPTPSTKSSTTAHLAGVLASTISLGKTYRTGPQSDLMHFNQQTLKAANKSTLPPFVATSSNKFFGKKHVTTSSLPYLGASYDSKFALKGKDVSRLGTPPTSSATVSSSSTISYSGLITKQPVLLNMNMSHSSFYKPERQTSVTKRVKSSTSFAKNVFTSAPYVYKTEKHSDLTTGSVTPDHTSYHGISSKGLDSTSKKSLAWSKLQKSSVKSTSDVRTSPTFSFSSHISDSHRPALNPSPWPHVRQTNNGKFATSTSSKLYSAVTRESKQLYTHMSSTSDKVTLLYKTISVSSTQIADQTIVHHKKPGRLMGHSTSSYSSYSVSHKVSPVSHTAVSFIDNTFKPVKDSNNFTNIMTRINSTAPTMSLGGGTVTQGMSLIATKSESFHLISPLATSESSTTSMMFPISQGSTTTEKPTNLKWKSHTLHFTQDSATTETSARVLWRAQTPGKSSPEPNSTYLDTGLFFDFAPENEVTVTTPAEGQSVNSAQSTQFGTVHIGFRDVKHHRKSTTPPFAVSKSSTTSEKYTAILSTSIPLMEKSTSGFKASLTVQRSPTICPFLSRITTTLPSEKRPLQMQETTRHTTTFHTATSTKTSKPAIKNETLHPTRLSRSTNPGTSLTIAKRVEPVSGLRTTFSPTTTPSLVARSLNFRLTDILYTKQLQNMTSNEYKRLKREVKLVMDKIFSSAFPNQYIECLIGRFLNGSVLVEAYVLFDYKSPAPSSSDVIRAVATDISEGPNNYFGWNIELRSVESHGYTINNLEPESFPMSFLVLHLGYVAMSQTSGNSKRFLENLKQEVIKAVAASLPVGNFSIVSIRDLRGDLGVRGNLYLNSQTNTDVQTLLQTFVALGNKSVDLSSITVDGYHMVLRVFPIRFQITNRQFVVNMLDLSSSEFQDLSQELSAVVLSALSNTNPLQVIFREIMRGSLLLKGDVVYQLPAPGSGEVLRAFISSLSSDGILGSSSFKVNPNSVQIGDSSPDPHFEYPSFPGFGVAIIVMCGLSILIFPTLAIVCYKTRMLGHRKKATIQRHPDLDRQSRHFEIDNRAFRASIEQP